ncbi:MAG TPA: DUF5131 family protein [Candidatus Lokiarchaeia archaeon]
MGLNKSKGQMYEWITHTWNPLGGKCPHGCSYCSTNKFYYPHLIKKYSGEVRLVESELKTNLGTGNFIFVCAQHDLFAEGIPREFIMKIQNHCRKFDNFYLFQSKNPEGFITFQHTMPEKTVICTTIETDRWYKEFMGNSPHPYIRTNDMLRIDFKKYVTIEPIMNFTLERMIEIMKAIDPIQINIGADSGNNHLPEPPKEKILELIAELEKFTVVKQKSNLKRLLK